MADDVTANAALIRAEERSGGGTQPKFQVIEINLPAAAGGEAIVRNFLPVGVKAITARTFVDVPASESAVDLRAANAARRGFHAWNAATTTAYINLGAAATLVNWIKKLEPDEEWVMDQPPDPGQISAIWAAGAGGSMKTMEYT